MDHYGPSGLAKIICKSPLKNEFSKMEFSLACHMCLWALDNKDFYNYLVDSLEEMKKIDYFDSDEKIECSKLEMGI